MATALWKRLDMFGHDAAVLTERDGEMALEGVSLFEADATVSVIYQLRVTHRNEVLARIDGTVGPHPFRHEIRRDAKGWTMDGRSLGLGHLRHLTFGFTPATSALLYRRERLTGGRTISGVHFNIGEPRLTEWPQHFRRRDRGLYDYRSPRRETCLRIESDGFIQTDPGIWQREA